MEEKEELVRVRMCAMGERGYEGFFPNQLGRGIIGRWDGGEGDIRAMATTSSQ